MSLPAYPYSGKPSSLDETSYPGDRTIYIQADTDLDEDGIAPDSLIDDAREMITTDPDTGLARPCMGLTDDTLYVESITRTSVSVRITGLDTPSGQATDVQTAVEAAVETYFDELVPYIDGIDVDTERNDVVTMPSISAVIQDVLESYASSMTFVEYNVDSAGYVSTSSYQLGDGELMKLSEVVYV